MLVELMVNVCELGAWHRLVLGRVFDSSKEWEVSLNNVDPKGRIHDELRRRDA
jgi:hypothetical protein